MSLLITPVKYLNERVAHNETTECVAHSKGSFSVHGCTVPLLLLCVSTDTKKIFKCNMSIRSHHLRLSVLLCCVCVKENPRASGETHSRTRSYWTKLQTWVSSCRERRNTGWIMMLVLFGVHGRCMKCKALWHRVVRIHFFPKCNAFCGGTRYQRVV